MHVVAERLSTTSYAIDLEDGQSLVYNVKLLFFKDAQGETKAINPTMNEMWQRMLEISKW